MAKTDKQFSRRDFARKAALFTVAAPLAANPSSLRAGISHDAADQNPPKLPADFPKLSEQSHAEAEGRYQAILKEYNGRFNGEQKADLRRLCFLAQPPLDHLRTYTVKNGDSPALYLKPTVEREKKPAKPKAAPAAKKPGEAAR
jgi:hypothetical protein